MKALAPALIAALLIASVSQAQTEPPRDDNPILRLLDLILPDQARNLRRLGPPDQYEAPEVLPNGDILIRRKPQPLGPPRKGEIDL